MNSFTKASFKESTGPLALASTATTITPAALADFTADWMPTEAHFAQADENAVYMHCLPVRRGVEIANEVLDGPRSRVLREAGNRLWVQMAALEYLLSP